METECPESIKRLSGIFVIAEAVPSEPFFMHVISAIPVSLFHAAAETDIALPVISIRQRNGSISKWIDFCQLIIFFLPLHCLKDFEMFVATFLYLMAGE